MDSIIKNFRSFYRDHKKLGTVFNLEQKVSIDQKLRSLETIMLEKDRLKPVYEIRDFTYFKESFPVIQEAACMLLFMKSLNLPSHLVE